MKGHASRQAAQRESEAHPARLWGLLAVLALIAAAALWSGPNAAVAHEGEDEPLPADTGDGLRPVYETPEGANRIIGSPDPGPDPQHSGDRGGSLQFATMGAVAAAVAFIMWRIARSSRRASRGAARTGGRHHPSPSTDLAKNAPG